MKKQMLAIFAVALGVTAVSGQKISEKNVPATIKKEFQAKFPAATNAKWEMENKTTYEVVFKLNNEEVSANYSKEGKWLETEKEIKASKLPKAVADAISKKYPNCKMSEIAEVESAEHGKVYDVELTYSKKKYTLILKSSGEVVKSEEMKAKKEND
jgi:Protein of unknown function (DUF2874).